MATKPEKSAGNAKRPDNKKKKPAFSAQEAREQKNRLSVKVCARVPVTVLKPRNRKTRALKIKMPVLVPVNL